MTTSVDQQTQPQQQMQLSSHTFHLAVDNAWDGFTKWRLRHWRI